MTMEELPCEPLQRPQPVHLPGLGCCLLVLTVTLGDLSQGSSHLGNTASCVVFMDLHGTSFPVGSGTPVVAHQFELYLLYFWSSYLLMCLKGPESNALVAWAPAIHFGDLERNIEILASAQPNTGHCDHLGSEPAYGKPASLHLFITWHFNKQTNK